MMYLSKSAFVQAWLCPEAAWLRKNKPEAVLLDENGKRHIEEGLAVGKLARNLFGSYCDVTVLDDTGHPDLDRMIETTRKEMEKETPVICEASFSFERCYCAVDILRKDGNGWIIYEVKSSTNPLEDRYIVDVAYQKYILENLGIKITHACVVCLNNQYILKDDLDLQSLFVITDVTDEANSVKNNIPDIADRAFAVLNSDLEPQSWITENCKDCACWKYCTRDLPKPNVFDLYRLSMKDKVALYQQGIISYSQAQKCPKIKNNIQKRQIDFALNERGTWIDQKGISEFLDTLSYPLYFLDFESMQPAIPFCQGTKPFSQIVFQYSLHYIERENGELMHKEFLAESGCDPRRDVAEALCRDIPRDVCVTAYNKTFECTRLRELAEAYPDLADHLTNIAGNIKDLLVPFQKGFYYKRAMGGSFSIKSVLPAIYPDAPSLDYHNLEGVHNGGEAMSIFPRIQYMSPDDQARARENLLRYCELDTYAMVKVWEELISVVKA